MFSNREGVENYELFQTLDNNVDTIIFKQSVNNNPLTKQGIKINHKTFHLIFFEKTPTNLTYIFDKDTILKFYFDEFTIMQLQCPKFKIFVSKIWTSVHNVIKWKDEYKELNFINAISK